MTRLSEPRGPQEREQLQREARRRWNRLAKNHPELAETIRVGRGLVKLYIEELPAAASVELTDEALAARLTQGQALLDDADIALDLQGIRHFFFRLCSWSMDYPDLKASGDRLQRAMIAEELDTDELIAAALAGEEGVIAAVAARLGVEETFLQLLVGFTVSAALMETGRELTARIEGVGVAWGRSHCPVCGAAPLFSELQGQAQRRQLRCAVCGAGWDYPLAQCVHCASAEPDDYQYLASEDQPETFRVDLCQRCRGYIKSVTVHTPIPAEFLTIEDAALLALSTSAEELGYSAAPYVGQGRGQE